MRRRLRDVPVQVWLLDNRPVRFRDAESEYEVLGRLKSIGLSKLDGDEDLRLWQVRAVRADTSGTPDPAVGVYDLECDHGRWHLVAVWEQGL